MATHTLQERLKGVILKLNTFKKERKTLSFSETGDAFLAVETLEKVCHNRQMRFNHPRGG